MNKIKIFIFSTVLGLQFVAPHFAFAQPNPEAQSNAEESIRTFLCTPTENQAANNDLVYCINKLYRFSIAISAVASVFFLVLAGYMRMASDGSSELITKSTQIITAVIAGNIILAFGYVFLRALNPEIVRIKPPVVKEILDAG
ncbi:MAG TPA: hypothetical protein VEA59_05600, partial [Patescibacteria group bacterium]|nr:hypothetical protein [Patescibacteria group bacterium]